MSPLKAEQLFKLMKQYGVEHFKTLELEIRMNRGTATHESSKPEIWMPLVSKEAPPPQAATPVETNIPHHVNEVASLLKLNDEQLVDKLFPDYSKMSPKDGE